MIREMCDLNSRVEYNNDAVCGVAVLSHYRKVAAWNFPSHYLGN